MKFALVTGGDRGIGFAISCKLAEEGYDIAIASRDKKRLDDAVSRISGMGVHAWAFRCDIAKRKDLEGLAKKVLGIGVPDVLVNNAGVASNKDFLEDDEEEIDRMIDVNVRGLMLCTRAFLGGMAKRKAGVIINIASGAGKHGFPGLAVYCATKFAVIGFTESLAPEVAKDGVLVYAVCPGATETDMWRSLYPGSKAQYQPEDVAIEVLEVIRNKDRLRPGSAIDVRKHI